MDKLPHKPIKCTAFHPLVGNGNKKSVLMTLNHNCGCFSGVAGIAGNDDVKSITVYTQLNERYKCQYG
jgi:hypothetical protein